MNKNSFRSWMVIVLVGLALTISQMDRTLLAVVAPKMIAEQNVTGTAISILLSSFVWTYTAFELPSGWLVDCFGSGCLGVCLCVLVIGMRCYRFCILVRAADHVQIGAGGWRSAVLCGGARYHGASVRRALARTCHGDKYKRCSMGPAMGTTIGARLLLSSDGSTCSSSSVWHRLSFLFPGCCSSRVLLKAPLEAYRKPDVSLGTPVAIMRLALANASLTNDRSARCP
jgi:MFS family permease